MGFGGRGGGGGGGRGGGRGWRNMYYATGQPGWARAEFAAPVMPQMTTADELTELKAQAGQLQSVLENIQKRMDELEAAAGDKG